MKRSVDFFLNEWVTDPERMPLLVRGARQVGKSHSILSLGKRCFEEVLEINFEQDAKYQRCFESLHPDVILNEIEVLSRKQVHPGKTLLFLDEIQDCPQAITALRYFYEQKPELHVIAAGSLLEFVLHSEAIKIPVGRIQYLHMMPLSFMEFLSALGEDGARKWVESQQFLQEPESVIHEHLLKLLQEYWVVGGMPAVVKSYADYRSIHRCQKRQQALLQTYRDDFGKYGTRAQHSSLEKVFQEVPRLLGSKLRYVNIDPAEDARNLKKAIELLEKARVLRKIIRTNGALPLGALSKNNHYKPLFVDVGLAQQILGMTEEVWFAKDLMKVHMGGIAEQFVGQELLAYQDPFLPPQLYYWERDQKSSQAEVDYLTSVGSQHHAIEVKAGKTGRLKSLHLLLEQHPHFQGIKCSAASYDSGELIQSLPLYALGCLFSKKGDDSLFS